MLQEFKAIDTPRIGDLLHHLYLSTLSRRKKMAHVIMSGRRRSVKTRFNPLIPQKDQLLPKKNSAEHFTIG